MGAETEKLYSSHISGHPDAIWISPYAENFLNAAEDYIPENGSLLEIGCGEGELVTELAESYPHAEITAIDIAQESVRKTTEKTAPYDNVEILHTSLDQFDTSEKYDAILASNSIHAMENPKNALARIHDLLADEANLVFTVPDKELGRLFPEKAVFYDEDLDLSGIRTELDVDGETLDYSQYLIDEDWLEKTAEEVGFTDFYAESQVPVNPEGIEYFQQIIHEEYRPEISRIADEQDPETNLWVMQK